MGKDILKVERLERVFRVGSEDVHALRGVSFTIQEGEFVSIMGTVVAFPDDAAIVHDDSAHHWVGLHPAQP